MNQKRERRGEGGEKEGRRTTESLFDEDAFL
jgi:hypothetical protein